MKIKKSENENSDSYASSPRSLRASNNDSLARKGLGYDEFRRAKIKEVGSVLGVDIGGGL